MKSLTSPDLEKRREPVYLSFDGDPGPCPRCGSALIRSSHTYVVATHRAGQIRDSLIIGNDMGWFCSSCPVVVIDKQQLDEMVSHSLPHWDVGNEYVVLGIVDLDAVPPDRRDVPLGEDDNPVPLIEFRYESDEPRLDSEHSAGDQFARRRRRKLLERKLRERRRSTNVRE